VLHRFAALIIASAVAITPAQAQTASELRISGTVENLGGNLAALSLSQGISLVVRLDSEPRVNSVAKGSGSDLKTGSQVSIQPRAIIAATSSQLRSSCSLQGRTGLTRNPGLTTRSVSPLSRTQTPLPKDLFWNQLVATHSFRDVRDGLDTLVVAGSVISVEQACKNPSLVECVRSMAPRVRRVASICSGSRTSGKSERARRPELQAGSPGLIQALDESWGA
jgi:hypothetical protein